MKQQSPHCVFLSFLLLSFSYLFPIWTNWTIWSKVVKFGTLVDDCQDSMAWICRWLTKGGCYSKLWTGISHAVFDLESWNIAHTCHPLQGTNLSQGHFPVTRFWILWKKLKILLPLGIFTDLHEIQYTQFRDQYQQFLFGKCLQSWQKDRGSCHKAMVRTSHLGQRGGCYSKQFKMPTLKRHVSCPV